MRCGKWEKSNNNNSVSVCVCEIELKGEILNVYPSVK
jgi:hypothetical protein